MSEKPNISSLINRSGNLTLKVMEKYLRNELGPEEQLLVEAHLENSPFDREALEGIKKHLGENLEQEVEELDELIMQTARAKTPALRRRPSRRYYWAAAAGLAVIATLTVLLVFMFRNITDKPVLVMVPPDTAITQSIQEDVQADHPGGVL